MRTYIYILLLTFLFLAEMKAQQPVQYSLYMLNQYRHNVAYAGMDDYLSATGAFRKQWLGLEGSPISQNINVHLPWQYMSGGAGLNIENDILGAERNTSILMSYNYVARFSSNVRLSLGIGGGIIQKAIDGSKLLAPEGNYEGGTINHNDDLIPVGVEAALAPMTNVGLYLSTKSLQIGVAAENLTEPVVSYKSDIVTGIQLKRNYTAYTAYKFNISDGLSFQPSFLCRSDFIETQVDFSILSTLNDNIFGGASFRGYNDKTIDALIIFGGMNINPKIRLAYAYDLPLSGLNSYHTGSHEVMINYNLRKEIGGMIPAKTIYNPRYY